MSNECTLVGKFDMRNGKYHLADWLFLRPLQQTIRAENPHISVRQKEGIKRKAQMLFVMHAAKSLLLAREHPRRALSFPKENNTSDFCSSTIYWIFNKNAIP